MDVFVGCFAFQLQLPLHCFSVMYKIFDYVTRFQQLRCKRKLHMRRFESYSSACKRKGGSLSFLFLPSHWLEYVHGGELFLAVAEGSPLRMTEQQDVRVPLSYAAVPRSCHTSPHCPSRLPHDRETILAFCWSHGRVCYTAALVSLCPHWYTKSMGRFNSL